MPGALEQTGSPQEERGGGGPLEWTERYHHPPNSPVCLTQGATPRFSKHLSAQPYLPLSRPVVLRVRVNLSIA